MGDPSLNQYAGHLRSVLQFCLLVLILWNLVFCARWFLASTGQWRDWTRHPALITDTSDGPCIEIEVASSILEGIEGLQHLENSIPYEPQNSRFLIQRDPYTWYRWRDQVTAVQNPQNPAEFRVLSVLGTAVPVLARVLILLALGYGRKTLGSAHWGESVSWSDGGWVRMEGSSRRAGTQADPAQAITESRASHKGVIFWCCLLGLIAIPVVGGAIRTGGAGQMLMAGVVIILLSLALYTLVETFSRVIRFDDHGLSDTTFFGARHVAWSTIGALVKENINQGAQEQWDRARKRSGSRPQTVEIYQLRDTQGRDILSMSTDLVPQPLFYDLRVRIEQQARGHIGDAPRSSAATANPGATVAAGKRATPSVAELVELREFEAAHRERSARSNGFMLVTMLLVALPFVAGTGWMTYRSLWYLFAAERAEGTIVEMAQGSTPSLTVEYRRRDGSTQRVETDGSASYTRFNTGDRLSVMYDPERPDRVRVDLIAENWLLVIIVGAITLLIVGTFWLIYRQFNAPFP
jgi:hypothetical protein